MSISELNESEAVATVEEGAVTDLFRGWVEAKPTEIAAGLGLVVGDLVGIKDEGRTPLVLYPGQPGATALVARTIIDLCGPHIGHSVVLMFEGADPAKPIVMGILRDGKEWPLAEQPSHVEVDADGERLIVSAKQQVVLRCGEASITLTKAGKVLIKGTYVLTRSSGVNRIKGGSVQIN